MVLGSAKKISQPLYYFKILYNKVKRGMITMSGCRKVKKYNKVRVKSRKRT
jgi:hypothetical protein